MPTDAPVLDHPVYWFAVLNRAIERSDFAEAAKAQRELEQLGVTVHYRGRHPVCQEVRDGR